MDLLDRTVNETIVAVPEAVGILKGLGIDTCCRGAQTLAEAARSVGLAPEALAALLKLSGEAGV